MNKKRGINLILLVITIIVLVVLTSTALLLLFNKESIILMAQEVVFKNNITILREELKDNILKEQVQDLSLKKEEINATKEGIEREKLSYWIPKIVNTEYENMFEIFEGNLVYIEEKLNEKEIQLCNEIYIKKKEEISVLPYGYQQIDYIESRGAQHINTQLSLTQVGKVVLDFQCIHFVDNKWFCGTGMNFEAGIYDKEFYTEAGFTYSQKDISKRTIATGHNNMTGATKIYLFARNWKGNNDNSYIRVFSCKIYDKENCLIRDYIPCYKEQGEIPGLYDLIEGKFYINEGSGFFNKSEKIDSDFINKIETSVPQEYQKVEYIQSSGEQYVNTNVILSDIQEVVLDFQNTSTIDNKWFCGTSSFEAGIYGKAFYSGAGFNYTQNGLNNRNIAVGINNSIISIESVYLFARNWRGNYNNAKIKLYSCQIYNKNNDLIRNYIPCYRKVDGKPGLYDTVTKKFFINGASGTDFILPQ